MPLLRQNIAHDQDRWADVAASSIATHGIPRQPLAELRTAEPPRLLPTLALRQLPEEKWQEMIIRRMIEHSDVHFWGSAATLQEFAKHPAVLAQMPARLRRPAPGAVYIAWWIVRADPNSPLRPVALAAAVKDLPNTDRDYNQRFAAVNLILEFGGNADKNALVETFRNSRQTNLRLYYELFSAAETKDSPVVLGMAGLMLDDRRVFGSRMRYCDLAVFALSESLSSPLG
jgi:hypothetical protein